MGRASSSACSKPLWIGRLIIWRRWAESLTRQACRYSNAHAGGVIGRLVAFFSAVIDQRQEVKEDRVRLKTLQRDIQSLADHSTFLSGKISFLLDAVLGMISIEQNGIIKIFSVAAVVFLPPTLVASIYGMKFQFMPDLSLWFGYPLALGLMVLSAVLPYFYFRAKGWL